MVNFYLKVKDQGQKSNWCQKLRKFQCHVTPLILIIERPNKKQNVHLEKLYQKNIMRFNISLPVRGQRSPDSDQYFIFSILIARISKLYSCVALTTLIENSWSIFPPRSKVKVKCQITSEISKCHNSANSNRRESK